MKITTMESQIDALLSTVFQSDTSSQQAVECVDRLLSAFKQAGRPIYYGGCSFAAAFTGEECYEN